MTYRTAYRKPHIHYVKGEGWSCTLRSFTSKPHPDQAYARGCARRCAPTLASASMDLQRARAIGNVRELRAVFGA